MYEGFLYYMAKWHAENNFVMIIKVKVFAGVFDNSY